MTRITLYDIIILSKEEINMKQYLIKPNEEFTSKCISIFADEYHETQYNDFIFTLNDEVIAIFNKDEFIVKE